MMSIIILCENIIGDIYMMKCNLMPNFDVDTKHSELKEIYRVIDINDEL